jgi:hypothetical protein
VTKFCNAYGGENPGGHPVAFGGFLPNPVSLASLCPNRAAHRFRWVCEHGHQGPIVDLCEVHWGEFTGAAEIRNPEGHAQGVPWNVRRDVRACPRCAAGAPDCDDPEHRRMSGGQACGCRQHKCRVRLVTVS